MKPSDFYKVHPWDSVDRHYESEEDMRRLIGVLAKTGDTFRELTLAELPQNIGRYSENEVAHFNKYLKSVDTIILYSPAYAKVFEEINSKPV